MALGAPENVCRIPRKHAPQSTTEAAALAFYFTKAFGEEEKWSIRWYAPVRGHELVRRRDLFPDERHTATRCQDEPRRHYGSGVVAV